MASLRTDPWTRMRAPLMAAGWENVDLALRIRHAEVDLVCNPRGLELEVYLSDHFGEAIGVLTIRFLAEDIPGVQEELLGLAHACDLDAFAPVARRMAAAHAGRLRFDDWKVPWARGRYREVEGDHAGAVAYYEEAVALAPDELAPHADLAGALLRCGRAEEGRASATVVQARCVTVLEEERAARHRVGPETTYTSARMLALLGKKKPALAALKKALRMLGGARLAPLDEADFDRYAEDPDFLALLVVPDAAARREEARATLAAQARTAVLRPVAACDWYLATELEQRIRMPAAHDVAARSAVLDHLAGMPAEALEARCLELPELQALPTLDAIFAFFETPLVRDANGDVVRVEQGGDLWAPDLLAAIAPFVEPGSFVSAVDDGGVFWRWEITGGELRFARSRASRTAQRLLA
jgi:tetratricopeptide (TPR) repeat protein